MSKRKTLPDRNEPVPSSPSHGAEQSLKAALTTPTPDHFRRLKEGQVYVPWSYMAGVMNDVWPGSWSVEIVGEPVRHPLPDLPGGHKRYCKPGCHQEHPPTPREEVIVRVRVTNPGNFVQEAFGSAVFYPTNPQMGYGDVLAAARSVALRRAIATWGPGLDVVAGEDMDLIGAAITTRLHNTTASDVWHEALARHNITEHMAIRLLSRQIAGDATLTTVDDLIAASGILDRKEAYQWLVETLDAMVSTQPRPSSTSLQTA